jgi:hypothetical protein
MRQAGHDRHGLRLRASRSSGGQGYGSAKRWRSTRPTSTRPEVRCWSVTAKVTSDARPGWTSSVSSSSPRGRPTASRCPSARCSASSTPRRWAHRPRHHVDVPSGHRPVRDHRRRPIPTPAHDLSNCGTDALTSQPLAPGRAAAPASLRSTPTKGAAQATASWPVRRLCGSLANGSRLAVTDRRSRSPATERVKALRRAAERARPRLVQNGTTPQVERDGYFTKTQPLMRPPSASVLTGARRSA